ncbi:MAG: hypothetical protein A2622_14210 [Bdellovibrionales bacterium RIFCSPHIGHO2_01_FULL_40_29]|nr:MAG: hypothetical protein A2622_14210 [Bdellovibrionales bacterium RIFCSPHIGHO2_01_FULL_40_29]OFZ33675.1 MAG: hypothetical protein A3D17_11820 [Bdellovibrionales bacterium RIFCSPHIGHO2_02_FULL_40_15]
MLPNAADQNHNNHDEIGHIHFYHSHHHAENQQQQQNDDEDEDENCPSSKSVFAYSNLPNEVYTLTIPSLVIAFDLVFILKNNFKTPYLEPRKKPPKFA